MKKITITIPKNKEKWKLNWGNGGSPTTRRRADLICRAIERRLLRTSLKEKTSITIKEASSSVNESLSSKNPKHLIWITVCFLEDYLNKGFIKLKLKKYEGGET